MSTPEERLDELKVAADDYLAKERRRLEAERDFLDNIFQGRGAATQVEDSNAQEASSILVNSITEYLSK